MNEELRSAMKAAGLRHIDIAARLCVDPKTVERWLAGRVPHPQTREALAHLVGSHVDALWPSVHEARQRRRIAGDVRAVYDHRWHVSRETWVRFFSSAESEIDVLVYAGLFLAEDAGLLRLLASKAQSGIRIRILAGDPDSTQVAQRGEDERIGNSTAGRIRNALALLKPLNSYDNIAIRLHGTVLYNSIFRADDEMLVNLHIYGQPGANAPVLRLLRAESTTLFDAYMDSFETVWQSSTEI